MIEEKLAELLDSNLFPPGKLAEAARYAVLSGGKRLRPQIVLATAELFGASKEKALVPACAIELVHSYSLIHDDLPCMDDDDFRRGVPSLHKAYSEGQALLTGDFLLNYAFELLAKAPDLTAQQRIDLIGTLSYRGGAHGMIGGQEMDIDGQIFDVTTLLDVNRRKTAALFTAAFEFGGIIAEVDDLSRLQSIGEQYGLLFQLLDDLADGDGMVLLIGQERTEALCKEYRTNLEQLLAPSQATLLFPNKL
jgi:geranylgeranyl diphosphate synthase type II